MTTETTPTAAGDPVRSEALLDDPVKELCDLLREMNMRVVFWVCPKGCRGRVTWNADKTDAKCEVCGCRKSSNNALSDTVHAAGTVYDPKAGSALNGGSR